eukprot:scaffold1294_cov244-Pinguiococcus_pyrenoidosus.AAC.2
MEPCPPKLLLLGCYANAEKCDHPPPARIKMSLHPKSLESTRGRRRSVHCFRGQAFRPPSAGCADAHFP